MLVAVFIKSYKIYKNIKFIPLSTNSFFSALIGQNGTGKSSVLEALESYFNNREWNINKQSRSGGGIVYINTPYVAPVFLIKKTDIHQPKKPSKLFIDQLEEISSFLWKTDRGKISSSSPELSEFFAFREELSLRFTSEDYYLIIAGKRHEQQNRVYFGPFHHQDAFLAHLGFLNDSSKDKKDSYSIEDEFIQAHFKGFIDAIINIYSFVYIPSDIDVSDYTKLETDDMQKLMDKDIKALIHKTIKQTSLDEINKSLNAFIDEIASKLNDYTYKKPTGGKSNITMPDLISIIIQEYFSIRFLTKKISTEYIPVKNLSSGEKRKALIDLAFAFLYKSDRKEKIVILGIDEPEISLHVSACFDQFEKLTKISDELHQVIITTHWYGFLPIIQSGTAIFLNIEDDKVITDKYALGDYREKIVQQKRKSGKLALPYDVFLKSYYDLVQSIVLSVRKPNSYKWILCEGQSERIYFSSIFQSEIENNHLRILPLGGCGEVVRIFQYLEVALEDKELEVTGSVLALIDTDEKRINFIPKSKKLKLQFKRFYYKSTGIELIDVESSESSELTEIEDVLRADLFYSVLLNIGSPEVKAVLIQNKLVQKAVWSHDFIDIKRSEKTILDEFFNSPNGNKTKFATAYISHPNFKPEKEPIYKELLKYL